MKSHIKNTKPESAKQQPVKTQTKTYITEANNISKEIQQKNIQRNWAVTGVFFPSPPRYRIPAEVDQFRRRGWKMRMVDDKNMVSIYELQKMATGRFGDLVKAVVDVKLAVMAIDAELHADEEALLLENGSEQTDLWGINLYPEIEDAGFIEYDSMINLRPSRGNRGRGVEDPGIREHIRKIVDALVIR
jgi:hypothetical protein